MRIQTKIFLFILCLLYCSQSAIPQNYTQASTANLISNIHHLGYSNNQHHLVVLQQDLQGSFFVYDGIRLNNRRTINITDEVKGTASPSAFAFSQDDKYLIIGTDEGSVFGYKIENDRINDNYSYNTSFGLPKEYFTVRSISIDKTNTIAISVKEFLHVLKMPTDSQEGLTPFDPLLDFKFNHTIQSVCWSVVEPTFIIVGTFGELSGDFALFNTETKTYKSNNTDKTLSIALSKDGNTIFKSSVDKNIEVYAYQIGDFPKLITSLNQTLFSTKIQVSGDGQYVGALTRAGRVLAWKIVSETKTNLKMQEIEDQPLELSFLLNFNESGSNLAIAQSGNEILLISKENSDQIQRFTLCQGSTYLNSTEKDCLPCSQTCQTCFTADVCISCTNDKFNDGDTCSKCYTKLNGCMTCESSQKCITCDENAHWNYEAQEGKCTCKDTFYEKAGACSECSDFVDCLKCSAEDYCTLCKDEGNFQTNPVAGKCVCKKSFWLNSSECIQCSKPISDCIDCTPDGKQCNQCQSPDRRPNPDGKNKCQCIEYRYENQTGQCQFCDPNKNCIECQPEDPHDCIKCDTQKNRKKDPQNGKCVCNDGFYDDSGVCKLCSDLIPDCDTCNSQVCSKCKNESNFNPETFEGKCICIDEWILNEKVCELCADKIIGCQTCSSITNCTTCNQTAHFVKNPSDQGKCICQSTHWFDGKECQLCSSKIKGCSTCSPDGSKCQTCQDPNKLPNKDETACDCRQFFYEDQNEVCQFCDTKHSCLHCNQTDPKHECSVCDESKHWNATPVAGACKCWDGYSEYDGRCVLCSIPGCTLCPTETTCEQCDKSKYFDPNPEKNKCNCIAGTYESTDKLSCLNCSVSILGCKECSNAADCFDCDGEKHFIINSESNKCDCMKSFYLKNNKTCEACNSTIDKCVNCMTAGTSIDCINCQRGWGPSTNKKSCVDCTFLSIGCTECSDSNHCTKCDEETGFVLIGTLCQCKNGLYLKDKQCLQCSTSIPGCTACNSESNCTACMDSNHFDSKPNKDNKCTCVDGWTLSEKQCKECSSLIAGCMGCSDVSTCTKCDDINHFELNDKHQCQCKQTFYFDGKSCQQCSSAIFGCEKCSQNGKTCDNCTDPNRELNIQKNQCNCKEYFYEDGQRNCKLCDPYENCVKCSSQSDHQCELCDTTKFWNQKPNQDGKCTCQANYIEFNNSCVLCQIVGCSQCQETNNCSQCQTSKNFIEKPVDGKCQCQIDTIFDEDRCYFCNQKMKGCKTCSKLTECQECFKEDFFVLNDETKLCQCDVQHYLDQNACKDCSLGIKYCQECIINSEIKQCIQCKKGFLPSDDKSTCLNCEDEIIGCIDCEDMTSCKFCDDENNFTINGTTCVCKDGFFLKNRLCANCSDENKGCTKCSSNGQECSSCDQNSNYVLNEVTKKCECKDGYFQSEKCETCESKLKGCKSCTQTGSQCLTCNQGFFLSQGQCQLCSSTVPGCTKCNNDGTKCSDCNTDKFILNEKTDQCDCIATYFLNISKCELCESKFIGCSLCDPDKCLSCRQEHFIYNNETKMCDCQERYFLDSSLRKCELCSSKILGCDKCSQNGTQCNECNQKQDFVINNTTKTCLCREGYFNEGKICQLCSVTNPGCTKCSSEGKECLSCIENSNFVYDDTKKTCLCKESYYVSSNIKCTLCSETISYCTSCKSSKGMESKIQRNSKDKLQEYKPQCLQCKDGFQINQSGQSCYCPGNDKEIVDGECVDKKVSNWIIIAAIGAGVLLIVGVATFVYLKCKKAKSRLDLYEQMEEGENQPRRNKQETILTSENSSNFVKSSGSLDIDQ